MPNVKAPSLPKKTSQGIPSVDLTADVRGTNPLGGLARGLQEVIPVAADRAADMKRKADDANFLSAKTAAIKWARDNVYATKEENPNAALNRTGDRAVGLTPEFETKYSEFAETAKSQLTSDEQRAMFDEFVLAHSTQLFKDLNGHERKEFETASAARYKDNLDATVSQARMAYDKDRGLNMELLKNSLADGLGEINRRADAYGAPQEVRKAEQLNFTTRVMSSILIPMSAQNPKAALKLMNANRGYLDFSDKQVQALEAGLESAGRKQEGLEFAKSAVAKTRLESEALKLLDDAERDTKNPMHPDAAEAARLEITRRYNARDAAVDKEQKDTFQRALDRMVNVPGWTPKTDIEYRLLAGTGYQYALTKAWETHNREHASDAAIRRYQAALDTEAERNFEAQFNRQVPEALDPASLDDPRFLMSLTSTGERPTDKSIARMRLIQAKAESKARVRAESQTRKDFVSQVNSWWESYAESRDLPRSRKETIVNTIMNEYDKLEASKKGVDPTYEEVQKLFEQMIEMGYGDPGARFFREPKSRVEAIADKQGSQFVTEAEYNNPLGRREPGAPVGTPEAKRVLFKRVDGKEQWLTEEQAASIRGNPKYSDWTEIKNASQ